MLFNIVLIISGVLLLYYGAESLVRGSCSFALRIGITPLVVGLIIAGFGTSMPELMVSVEASLMGRGEIALGNVIGSNICNIGLILGLTTMIRPIVIKNQLIQYDTPIMIGISVIFVIFLIDGDLTRWKGILFITGLVVYTVWSIYFSKIQVNEESPSEVIEQVPALTKNVFVDWLFIIAGLVGLWLGSRAFVTGTVTIAQALGVSDAVIGLTIIAFGTSLPELATSIIAIINNHRDLAIGNLIGSNIFNILSIVGTTAIIKPFHVKGIDWVDYSVMLLFAIVIYPFMKNDKIITRTEGAFLFTGYIVYIGYLYYYQTPFPF